MCGGAHLLVRADPIAGEERGGVVAEPLPARALLLHTRIPASVPIIVADSPLVRRYVQPLIDHNVVPPGRILFHKLSKDGTVLHADNVYTVLK